MQSLPDNQVSMDMLHSKSVQKPSSKFSRNVLSPPHNHAAPQTLTPITGQYIINSPPATIDRNRSHLSRAAIQMTSKTPTLPYSPGDSEGPRIDRGLRYVINPENSMERRRPKKMSTYNAHSAQVRNERLHPDLR